MLRCRVQHAALRQLFVAFNPLVHRGLQRGGFRTIQEASRKGTDSLVSCRGLAGGRGKKGKRRSRSDGNGGRQGGDRARKLNERRKAVVLDGPKRGSPELHGWKLAMLELAGRYSVEVDPENLDKISLSTAAMVPDALERWREVLEGGNDLWFRGAAKFYASLLAGVWPKMANYFLSDLMGACNGGSVRAQRQHQQQQQQSMSSTPADDVSGHVNWRQGLEILREAKSVGVKLSPEVMVVLLSRVPPGNSRKISRVVTSELSRLYGLEASPDMLAIAAVAYWRAGVVTGACRFLDEMGENPVSPSLLVQNWLAQETRHVYAASRSVVRASIPRRWTWRLVVVDIYGRGGRWAEAADAFDAFVGESFGNATNANVSWGRLPLPEEPGGDLMTADGEAAAVELWSSVHPSPLAHAVTAYIKLNKVDAAARTLSSLRTSLTAAASLDAGYGDGDTDDPSRDSKSCGEEEALPLGPPDPAWVAIAVRGFARMGRWDLITEVLCPEVCGWASDDAGPNGDERAGGFQLVLSSLKSFLEHKSRVKKPVPGQVLGAKACLEIIEGIGGDLQGWAGDDVGGAQRGPVTETLGEAQEEVVVMVDGASERSVGSSSTASVLHSLHQGLESVEDRAFSSGEYSDGDTRRAVEQEQRAIYVEALHWLMVVETEGYGPAPLGEASSSRSSSEALREDYAAADDGAIARLLRSRAAALEHKAVLEAIRRAWKQDSFEDRGADRRRSAAFALYEAGVETGVVEEDMHWTSPTAGVLDLHCGDYRQNRAVPLAALHLVLKDMLRKYAFEQEVPRHVHHPHADLVMIAGMVASGPAINTVNGVVWLLRDRFGDALGDLEILGRPNGDVSGRQNGGTLVPSVWEGAEQVSSGSRRGVVLCLPRRKLQRWLLVEGRAKRQRCCRDGAGGDESGKLWSPSWVEDGIDAMPPVLPGRENSKIEGTSRGIGGSSNGGGGGNSHEGDWSHLHT